MEVKEELPMRGCIVIGLLIALLLATKAAAEPLALTVRAEENSILLAGHLEVLPDPSSALTLDDVLYEPADFPARIFQRASLPALRTRRSSSRGTGKCV
jgi:hypothetical protein